MKEHFQKLFEYNNWANNKILEVFLMNKDFPADAYKYFSHLLLAEKIWIERINGIENLSNNVWHEIPKSDLQKLINESTDKYLELINNSNDKHFAKEIKYKNSKGLEFTTVLKDILAHVAAHGTYHRGQINTALRSAGLEPVNVDYITYTRI